MNMTEKIPRHFWANLQLIPQSYYSTNKLNYFQLITSQKIKKKTSHLFQPLSSWDFDRSSELTDNRRDNFKIHSFSLVPQAHSRIRKTEQRKKNQTWSIVNTQSLYCGFSKRCRSWSFLCRLFRNFGILSFISRACGTLGGLPTVPSGLTKWLWLMLRTT